MMKDRAIIGLVCVSLFLTISCAFFGVAWLGILGILFLVDTVGMWWVCGVAAILNSLAVVLKIVRMEL